MITGAALLHSFGSPERLRSLALGQPADARRCGAAACQPSTGPNLAPVLIAVAFVTFFYCALLFLSVGRHVVAPGAVNCGAADSGGSDDDSGGGSGAAQTPRCAPYTPREVWAAWSWLLSAAVALCALALAGRVMRVAADFEASAGVRVTGRCCTRRAAAAAAPAALSAAPSAPVMGVSSAGGLAAADAVAEHSTGDESLVPRGHRPAAGGATMADISRTLTVGIGQPVHEPRTLT